ncbi:MAG: hypothetical protein J0I20_10890 [Chloroflexi bacterium]|mgnify:CR=1 FL=1|nr:hypothetical protein [Chloroflexota bacterium]OJV94417.1 MAG: hypothetical protein BGO39_21900 [Chloroflexi bacterium 54-19]
MEDYIEKIKQLPDDRLTSLIDGYRKTLDKLNEQHRMAVQAAMINVADYARGEIEKKQTELVILEKLLAERH